VSDIVIYENGEVALKATVKNEMIWLRQNQIAEIFSKDRTVKIQIVQIIFSIINSSKSI